MSNTTTELPKLIARLTIIDDAEKEYQFDSKIFQIDNVYLEIEDLFELMKRAKDELTETFAQSGKAEIMSVKSSFVELPKDPIIQVQIETLGGLSLEYALASLLDWKHPLGGDLSYQFGAIQHTHSTADFDSCGHFSALTDMTLAAHFMDKYKISLLWSDPKAPGESEEVTAMGSIGQQYYRISHPTLQLAITWFMVTSLAKGTRVGIPLSILNSQSK